MSKEHKFISEQEKIRGFASSLLTKAPAHFTTAKSGAFPEFKINPSQNQNVKGHSLCKQKVKNFPESW
jgi:hypothetical protein